MLYFGTTRVEFAFLPSVLGFFISSTLMSFFLTLRVEFTSLCNLLNFTDSSVSSSDCSLDWQRNKGKVNQIIAPELGSCRRVQPSLTANWTWGTNKSRQQVHEAPPTMLRSKSVANQILGNTTHTLALAGHVVHLSQLLPRPLSGELRQDSVQGWPCYSSYSAVVWVGLSSVGPIRTCSLTWSSTTSPNQNSVDLFQSSPKIKNSRAGKGKRCKKPPPTPFVRSVCHISAIPSASPSSFRELARRTRGQTLHSSKRDKGKSWPFQPYSAVHIPQHPISFCNDSSMLSPAVFPQVSNITEREKKNFSAAVTQARNNPFLVNKMRLSLPSQLQHSTCSFLCFICSKCANGGAARAGCSGILGVQSPAECAASALPSLWATPANPAHPGNSLLSISSNLVPWRRRERNATNGNTKQKQTTSLTLNMETSPQEMLSWIPIS